MGIKVKDKDWSWSKRWFQLEGDRLFFYKTEKVRALALPLGCDLLRAHPSAQASELNGIVQLAGCELRTRPHKSGRPPTIIEITHPERKPLLALTGPNGEKLSMRSAFTLAQTRNVPSCRLQLSEAGTDPAQVQVRTGRAGVDQRHFDRFSCATRILARFRSQCHAQRRTPPPHIARFVSSPLSLSLSLFLSYSLFSILQYE
jgi:hypothetical protein